MTPRQLFATALLAAPDASKDQLDPAGQVERVRTTLFHNASRGLWKGWISGRFSRNFR
jgi:hypothetical protein